MALIVETGSGSATANSYVDAATATTYLAVYPDSALYWNVLTTTQQETLLTAAVSYLNSKFRFYGKSLTDTQALPWPRTKNYDSMGNIMNPGTIPVEIKKAQSLLAMYWQKENGLFNSVEETGVVKKFSSEGIDVEFDSKSGEAALLEGKRFPEIELLLKNMGEFKTIDWFNTKKTDAREDK